MKLQSNPLLPSNSDPQALLTQLQRLMREVSQQVNGISEGKAAANYNASTVAPADGTGNPGDFVAKKNVVASGPVGNQVALIGWRCVSTGASTQWMEVIESIRPPPPTVAPTPAPTSAPAPAATPYSETVLAQNMTLHGVGLVTTIAGYDGTGHADWFRSGFDEYVEVPFVGPTSGSASGDLTIKYANYGDQTITLLQNGATTGTRYTFANSGGVWANKVISGFTMPVGANTVRMTPEWSGYTYIAKASFAQTTGGSAPPPPAPAPGPAPTPAPAPAPAPGSAPYYPFGSRLDGAYPFGIKPNGVHTNATMDAAVKACYDAWKLTRLAKSPTFVGTNPGIFAGQTITDGYHVAWETADNATRSEGIGYGMLITVLMAGYDANAKTYFDGMYKVARGRPAFGMTNSGGNANIYLMDYLILPNMDSGDGWSAADGDMDIALALLMAHRQWGSSGAINYYQQAINTINALKAADFASNGVMYARNVSRVSDYMPGHFRAFKAATNDAFWDNARTNSLALAQFITTKYSPTAKLQPGFIFDPLGANPRPDTVVHLDRSGVEQLCDQNSVRNPWRWATDYVFSGDAAWKALASDIVSWLKTSSGGSASGFSWAYNLDGSPLSGLYHEGTTSGCVMAGCMVDASHQTFLNTLFAGNIGSGFRTEYFESELMLLPLIFASGNWWRP